ncbi:D-aminoacid aminotransferase-like PLP-dependentenzymes superfamily protein [Striga asiatica]|uniref:D-aminoacid aminotransferase-like PLP-dependentenzymes superfamily protein n=1 Tax=Striga asiatica TaxID=4170 RepID=A0A5A7QZZ5_STRAF|nr:D-aminoacid aminotransferase-like PLP-dependentenzymes superfamily protein [Striga asiatica]
MAPKSEPAVRPTGRKGTAGKTASTQNTEKANEPRITFTDWEGRKTAEVILEEKSPETTFLACSFHGDYIQLASKEQEEEKEKAEKERHEEKDSNEAESHFPSTVLYSSSFSYSAVNKKLLQPSKSLNSLFKVQTSNKNSLSFSNLSIALASKLISTSMLLPPLLPGYKYTIPSNRLFDPLLTLSGLPHPKSTSYTLNLGELPTATQFTPASLY